uniref:J domain-containing protein n=1 Tax=Callorhinchus milii TaxID=7868 RepID=A0A4W3IIT3_CALMI
RGSDCKTAYYDLLQISPTATRSQIKTAYYKQSFIFHPDKNAGSEQAVLKFTQISEAYSVLTPYQMQGLLLTLYSLFRKHLRFSTAVLKSRIPEILHY